MKKTMLILVLMVFGVSACEGVGSEMMDDVSKQKELVFPQPTDTNGSGPEISLDGSTELAVPLDAVELAPEDLAPECEPGTGCFLEPCSENTDCQSGWCVEHMGDGVCTLICQEECPDGWKCKQLADVGPDLISICVSDYANLCKPCTMNSDCKSVGSMDDLCVSYGDDGAFCGGMCGQDDQCPVGFECKAGALIEGASVTQCMNKAGECACTAKSIALDLWTVCKKSNDLGTCEGKRRCSKDGLTACDAEVASLEVCDSLDNDCDGIVDDVDCDDGNPCTKDACNPVMGCTNTPASGGACDDANICTEGDKCEGGICIGTPVTCDDDNDCTDDLCDVDTGCMNLNNAAPCEDADLCTAGDKCMNGVCTSGQPIDCDDANVCTDDSCDSLIGCVHVNNANPCDDADVCTMNDFCAGGECAGAKINCDDGSLCTADMCDPDSGCVYAPVDCSDDDPCTQDYCAPAAGCIHDPLSPCCGNGVVELPEECDDGNDKGGDGCSSNCKIEAGNCPPPGIDDIGHCWIRALTCNEGHQAACDRIDKQPTPTSTNIQWSEAAAIHITEAFGCTLKKGCCATTMFCSIGPGCLCRVDSYEGTFFNWSNCVDNLPPVYACYY